MAIFGTLDVLKKQTSNQRLIKAIEYLGKADLQAVFSTITIDKSQKVEIEGDKIFAIFQTYNSKKLEDVKLEGHRKYIDIQYIFSGEERILLASSKDIVTPYTYNSEKDIYFPAVKSFSHIQLRAGDGAIISPEDIHGPCCCVDKPKLAQKIVVKVAVE
jgi:biofilm protein TabA